MRAVSTPGFRYIAARSDGWTESRISSDKLPVICQGQSKQSRIYLQYVGNLFSSLPDMKPRCLKNDAKMLAGYDHEVYDCGPAGSERSFKQTCGIKTCGGIRFYIDPQDLHH